MSVIFGKCVPRGQIVAEQALLNLSRHTERYGPDGTSVLTLGRVGMGFQGFHTNARSSVGPQPTTDERGNIVAMDGRLDNYSELATQFGLNENAISDSTLILRAFEKWGGECFSHLIGDWAVVLWSIEEGTLYLARDHAGSRALYYAHRNGQTLWSTYLETFAAESATTDLDDEYLECSLSYQPTGERTPYKAISAVKPAYYVAIHDDICASKPHWHPTGNPQIIYRSTADYDEHFRSLFRKAVGRRIGNGEMTLAQLSGGMDSTSIVCMADRIVQDGHGQIKQLDTVSFFDDTEPDWDERPYFTAVERFRNKKGIHVDCSSSAPSYDPLTLAGRIYPYVCGDQVKLDAQTDVESALGNGRYRVILSGIGGDELLGGVPTPLPELADYLREGRILTLISNAAKWGIATRQPLLLILKDTICFLAELYRQPSFMDYAVPPWLTTRLRPCSRAKSPSNKMVALLKIRPSAMSCLQAVGAVVETLPHLMPPLVGCYEYRYPYLDRDLVEFMLRIPRDQLVQPNRRRLLMRRALKGIVPVEILERKRKGFVSHGPVTHLRASQRKVEALCSNGQLDGRGLINPAMFASALRAELAGETKWIGHLARTVEIELWLRSIKATPVPLSDWWRQPNFHDTCPPKMG